MLDLRLLGVWRSIPVALLAPPAVAVASAGLGIALITGPLLLIVQASEYFGNPFLYLKFAAILVGLVNVAALRFVGDWTGENAGVWRIVAGLVSLLAWLTALTAGRLIAYW